MKLNLPKDRIAILKYVKDRIRDYPVYVNAGPGADEDPVTQITLGYQFDQAGWVALVFDTRPNAKVDGEWQSYIEENELPIEYWMDVYEELYVNEGKVPVIYLDGSKATLEAGDDLANVIGEFLRDLLIACRDDGLFSKLPCANNCWRTIEEHEGQYGWSDGTDGPPTNKSTDEEPEILLEVTDELRQRVGKLSQKKQISFWIERLDQIAADTKLSPDDTDDVYFDEDGNADALAEIGNAAVVPMLNLVLKYASKSQFQGDRTPQNAKGEVKELYRSSVMSELISKIEEIEYATPEIETLLRKIVTKAMKANTGRTLWGRVPFLAAMALHKLFADYPCPQCGDSDNRLASPELFIGAKKK